MILRRLLLVLFLACPIPAMADWIGRTGEDPITDKQWAGASVALGSFGLPSIVFKCWDDGDLQLSVIAGRYDEAASYSGLMAATFRVDKQEPVEINLLPTNFDGMLSLATASEVEPGLVALVRQILEGKQRVALSVGNAVYQTNVRGTTKAISAMFRVCRLAGVEALPLDQTSAISPPTLVAPEKCAPLLKAVQPCEKLLNCQQASIAQRFSNQRAEFEAAGVAPVRVYEQCREVCRRGKYDVQPVRSVLCGY